MQSQADRTSKVLAGMDAGKTTAQIAKDLRLGGCSADQIRFAFRDAAALLRVHARIQLKDAARLEHAARRLREASPKREGQS
jgi:hypothetical protein